MEGEGAPTKPAVVIDHGSVLTKVGFAGEDAPRMIFPTLVGRRTIEGQDEPDIFIGDEANKRRNLEFSFPITRGTINSGDGWNDMSLIWRYAIEEILDVNPSEHCVLVTETPLNPKSDREKLAECMIDDLGFRGVYVAKAPVLALFSKGCTTGVVLDSGGGVSCAVPVFEGYALSHAIQRQNIGGLDLTNYLTDLLAQRSITFYKNIIRDIKEKTCFVSQDFARDMEKAPAPGEYELPDGKILVGSERFRVPEALFQPSLMGMSCPGIHQLTFQAIARCDFDIRNSMIENIVLSGGSTMFPGMVERMTKELGREITRFTPPPSVRPQIATLPERKSAAWIGGSLFASLPTVEQMWVTKSDMTEYGSSAVHRKCF